MKILFFKEGNKVLTKKKKIFILCGMVALLVITGCLNLFLSRRTEEVQPTNYTSSSLLATYRVNKRESRQAIMDYIESVISASTNAEQISEMTNLVKELMARIERENDLETAIMSAGYEDAIVTESDDSYSIVVKCNSFSDEDASTILSILVRETGGNINPNTVSITPV